MMFASYDIHWFSRPLELDLAVNHPRIAAAPALPTLGARLSMPIPGNAGQRAVGSDKGHRAEKPRGLFDRTIGFWLGGALLGIGGCILGGLMPYSHPVAVTISVLWWGIYLGCLGASIGALLGCWAERPHTSPSQVPRTKGRHSPNAIVPETGLEPAQA